MNLNVFDFRKLSWFRSTNTRSAKYFFHLKVRRMMRSFFGEKTIFSIHFRFLADKFHALGLTVSFAYQIKAQTRR